MGGGDFDAQTVSLDLNGTDENLYNSTLQAYGIGNAWTIAGWWKPNNLTANMRWFGFDRVGAETGFGDSAITLSMIGAVGQDPVRCELYDGSGILFKRWDWNNKTTEDDWNFHVFTWDGTDIQLYADGVLQTVTTKSTDNAGSQSNVSTRRLYLGRAPEGNYVDGRMHSVGIWNVVLSGDEIWELYNRRIGNAMNWGEDGTDYVSSANLQHWWRLGHSSMDIGADSGKATAIDINANSSNISAADIVSDAPDDTFLEQTKCVDFDGSTERLANLTEQAIGVANAFTVACWFKPNATAFTQANRIVSLRRNAAGDNTIILDMRGELTNDPVRVTLADSGGTTIRDYHWESMAVQDAWNLVVFTWDGTDLLLYHDGTLTAETTQVTSGSGTLTDSANRYTVLGATQAAVIPFSGRIHSVGVWNSVLTSGEQAELYNSGDGSTVDLGSDGVTYASSANLQHWWRPGHRYPNIGEDFGKGSSIDVTEDADNITVADIVTDAP